MQYLYTHAATVHTVIMTGCKRTIRRHYNALVKDFPYLDGATAYYYYFERGRIGMEEPT